MAIAGNTTKTTLSRIDPLPAAAIVVAVVGLGTIGGFFFFQYVLGYLPCPLCLDQRIPYYVGVPLAGVIALGSGLGAPRRLLSGGLGLITIAMLIGAGLAVYHAGIEWGWWPGPTDCSGPLAKFGTTGNLLQQIQTTIVVRCDVAAWRFLGLSLAGYNVFVSLGLAIVAVWGALAARDRG